MMTPFVSALVFASAGLTIFADYKKARHLVYVFKPLTMLLIILAALRAGEPLSQFYRYSIVAGLGCSSVGDIFLMLPQKRFMEGLVSFLVAHLFYIAAFLSGMTIRFSALPLLLLLLYAIIMLRMLFPHLGKMKLPVLIYILVITATAWIALERFLQIKEIKTLLAFSGALFFVISDSSLALNRFVRKSEYAQAFILSTYFSAQWLIAMSI